MPLTMPMPPAVPTMIVPVGWIVFFILISVVAIIGSALAGFSWLRRTIREEFRAEIRSEVFSIRVREIVGNEVQVIVSAQTTTAGEVRSQGEKLDTLIHEFHVLQLEHAGNHGGG